MRADPAKSGEVILLMLPIISTFHMTTKKQKTKHEHERVRKHSTLQPKDGERTRTQTFANKHVFGSCSRKSRQTVRGRCRAARGAAVHSGARRAAAVTEPSLIATTARKFRLRRTDRPSGGGRCSGRCSGRGSWAGGGRGGT